MIRVHLPPLKERRQDIPKLARHFLHTAAQELNVEAKDLALDTEKFLAQLDWPGNVRQLENTCRWLTVMESGKQILLADLPPELTQAPKIQATVAGTDSRSWQELLAQWVAQKLQTGAEDILAEAGPEFERIVLKQALHYTHGHKQDAARKLGWGRNTLTRKLKELDME